ncbi:MAG: hypothetical protein RQ753_08350 [Desulfurivibrionaceae bacterium]|nr:hypothetical protein [Desulfurivibrionaceae bacterium]
MTIYHLLQLGKNFYYTHTYLALAILAGLVILALINPKAAFKTVAIVLLFVLAVYFATLLGKTSLTGIGNKQQMINQSRH